MRRAGSHPGSKACRVIQRAALQDGIAGIDGKLDPSMIVNREVP